MRDELERRIRRLERTVLGLSAALALAVGLGAMQAGPKMIRAQKVVTSELEIVAPEGRSFGGISLVGGEPRMSLRGKTGEIQAVLGVMGEGGTFMVSDEQHKAGVHMNAGPAALNAGFEGVRTYSSLYLSDGLGEKRIEMNADEKEKFPIRYVIEGKTHRVSPD